MNCTRMIRKGKYWIIFGITLFLSSCYTASLIEADVLNPAKQSISQDIYRVGVVSRMDLDVKRTAGRIVSKSRKAFERDSMMLKNAVLGLLDGLAESPRFDAYEVEGKRVLSGGQSNLNRELSWTLIDTLAAKDELDLIISLTAANFKDTLLLQKGRSTASPDLLRRDSQLLKELYKQGYSEAYIFFPHLYWRLYHVKTREIKKYVQIDTIIHAPGPVKGYPSRATTAQYFYEALGDCGYSYSKIFAPYWTTEERVWYPTGDANFYKAGKLANEGKWLEASVIWQKLAYSENMRIAAKASLNMAVASEMLDKIDIAIVWAERALKLGPDYYPKQYLTALRERQKLVSLLDDQMK